MNHTKKLIITISLSCLTFITLLPRTKPVFENPQKNDANEVWITIFVHGIMSIKPHLSFQNLMRFLRDDIKHTTYSKTVEYMRQNPYFYLNQAMREFGLHKIDTHDLQPGHASNALANIYDQVTAMNAPHTTSHYYTFGWAGLLSPTVRYKESIILLRQLTEELEKNYWSKGITPKIRLIGYSHGGNVCLNIAAARNNEDPQSKLSIDELILVGVPIQTETDYLAADDIFKKIYHFYSRLDRIQRIDFFSFNRVFSRRYFRNSNSFKVPKKLMQIEMRFTRHSDSTAKNERRIQQTKDFTNPGIVSGKSRLLRNASPGHLEFWFYGWSPKHYRHNFILHPLPAFITIPYIISCVNQVRDKLETPYPVIVDIRPEIETMLIKQRKNNDFTAIFPFITQEQFNLFSKQSYAIAPDSSFEDEYSTQVKNAFDKAQELYQQYDHKRNREGAKGRNRRLRKRHKLDSKYVPQIKQVREC